VDEHYRCIELPITVEQFHRLPRNAAYKYEYYDGRAVLTPRPKAFTCLRGLGPVDSILHPDIAIRPLPAAGIRGLTDLFFASVVRTQPFQSLDEYAARAAAEACIERTATGEDGPIVEPACFTAADKDGTQIGAVLVTLVPSEVLTDPFPGLWREPPPADAVERRLGVPHLTWVFVRHWEHRKGVGTCLLGAAVRAVADLGYQHLASTFLLDNGPSALWHWRNGFQLRPQWSLAMAETRRQARGRRQT
jgi:hypothetical protein